MVVVILPLANLIYEEHTALTSSTRQVLPTFTFTTQVSTLVLGMTLLVVGNLSHCSCR